MIPQRSVDGISQTIVEGQCVRDLPGVLGEDIVQEGICLNDVAGALSVAAGNTEKVVEEGVTGRVRAIRAERVGPAVACIEEIPHGELAAVIAKLQAVVTEGLGEVVVKLNDLIDTRLRAVGG